MRKEIKKAPTIRFQGFTEDWEQRKLGELAEIVGGGTPSTSVESYWDGDIDWYAPAEIGEQIYLKSSQRKITEEGLNKSSAKVLPVGTVLFTSRAGIGKTAILLKEGCTNQGFQSIVPNKDKLDSYFIFTRSEELKRYGETVGAGSTFVEVSGKQMANMELMMPTIMDEQQKIGEYFSYLDHLITLHQRKFDELKTAKTYFLQNMFPAKGEKVPRIRFHGFTGDWEQRKLGELGEIMTGSTPSTSNSEYYSEDGIPWVTPTDINSQTISDTPRKLSEEGMKVGRVVPANTILCTCIASIGKNTLLTVKGSFNQQINCLTPNEYNDAYFLLTESVFWSNIMKRIAAVGTMQIVNKTEFSKLTTMVPKLEEQKKIGQYFRALDHIITLHQRKLDQLKTLKKFMLQNLFI
ncbi:MAG: restriction endonuclease subunit S [Allisonella histaminiformans]|uniref:restriction endonuclease subunit S n=1 Tax=Allisonella histaminiformans TaxID=209880 RepID=UPI002A81AEAB|nr:restriction endonuclease subunit S [Allisonella histaminiformans]MDY3957582.1 restriction endonuclease subunit S [Allisonella histaminiformans]